MFKKVQCALQMSTVPETWNIFCVCTAWSAP